MKRRIRISSDRSVVSGIGIGAAVSLVVSILLSAGLTGLVLSDAVAENGASIYTAAIRAMATILGCMVGTGITKGNRLPVIGGTCLCYLLALLAITIVFFDGMFYGFGLGLLSVLCGGVIVWLIKLKQSKNKRSRIRLPK